MHKVYDEEETLSSTCTLHPILGGPTFSRITQNNLSYREESPATATVLKYPRFTDFGKVIRLKRQFRPLRLTLTFLLLSYTEHPHEGHSFLIQIIRMLTANVLLISHP